MKSQDRLLQSVIAIVIVMLVSVSLHAQYQSFINLERVIHAYGVSTNDFTGNKEIFDKSESGDLIKIGSFENGSEIDTAAEFVTAAFYSKHRVKDSENQKILAEELSAGKTGAIRLAALWLKKRVLDGKMYEEPIAFIQQKSEISEQEMLEYYRLAVSAEVDEVVKRVMKDIPVQYYSYFRDGDAVEQGAGIEKINAIDVLKEYYVYPSKENYDKLLDSVRYFGRMGAASDKAMVRFKAFVRIIDILSPKLRQQIIDDIFKDEAKKDDSNTSVE